MKARSLNSQDAIDLFIAGAMAAVVIIGLTLLAAPVHADTARSWSVGGGIAADPNGEYTGLVASQRWLPKVSDDINWGVHVYEMVAQYNHHNGSGTSVVVGAAPVLTWKWFYAGMGATVNNTTPNLGTPVNFSSILAIRVNVSESVEVEGSVIHISHGASIGIAEDKPNGGVTTIGLQGIWRF